MGSELGAQDPVKIPCLMYAIPKVRYMLNDK